MVARTMGIFCNTDFHRTYIHICLLHRMTEPEVETVPNSGSSYNSATENDTKVISAAVAMFQGTPDPPPPTSTLHD